MAVDIRGRKMKKPPACVQCRKRKIGCNRVKPICGNCLRNGKNDCFYPDIPGVYVQSNTASTSAEASHGIGSLEQMREFNTRMQLMTSSVTPVSSNGLRAETARFIPRMGSGSVPNSSGRKYEYGENTEINLVRGPAIFDTARTSYTQEEILAKELEFIRARLIDLEQATEYVDMTVGDYQDQLDEDEFEEDCSLGSREGDMENTPLKKRKLEAFDEFQFVDPAFLDAKQVLRVVIDKSRFFTSHVPIPGNENRLFQIGHLAMRDDYLCYFYNHLYDIMSNTLPERLSQQQHARLKPVGSQGLLRFPPKSLCTHWVSYFMAQTDISTLVPFLHAWDIAQSIDQWFPQKDVVFNVETISLDQMATLGLIILYLLFCYQSLSSTVLVPLKEDDQCKFDQLQEYVPQLHANLTTIMITVSVGGTSSLSYKWKLRMLPFVAALKYYQTISGWSITPSSVDYNEDVNWSLDLGINHETEDRQLIILWNFIYRNCCWRKLIRGELPFSLLSKLSSSAKILDTALLQDYEFLKCLVSLLQYLHSREETLNVIKLEKLKLSCREALDRASNSCFNIQLMVSNVVDTLLYRNMEVFVDFYMLLHYESVEDHENFDRSFKDFIQFLQESVFYIFSELANLKFAGYEYTFGRPTFIILQNIQLVLFSLAERTHLGNTKDRPELKQMNEAFITLVRKIYILISDYSKNCKKENPVVTDIKTIVSTLLEASSHDVPRILTSIDNGFLALDALRINKNIAKLRTMSDTLIKTDFYEKRGPFVTKPVQNFGVTAENFSSVYKAFFNDI